MEKDRVEANHADTMKPEAPSKKSYQSPRLLDYGTVSELTLTNMGAMGALDGPTYMSP